MWQDAGQMGKVTLVDGQETFGFDGLVEAVGDAAVEVAGLVVEARHDCIFCGCSVSSKF